LNPKCLEHPRYNCGTRTLFFVDFRAIGKAPKRATIVSQTLTSDGNAVEAIYNANGVRQQGLQKGLNIVKMQNGQNMKVYVK